MSKTAAVVLAFLSLMLLATPSRAQLLPSGNIYLGPAYADSTDVINHYTFRGWNASIEDLPFARWSHLGLVLDGSGFYRKGVQQYNLLLGPRFSVTYGKWRPFVQLMGGAQRSASGGMVHYPIAEDIGGGVDHKFKLLFLKNFSWRLQFDYTRTHLLSATQNDFQGSAGLVWRF
ncbi:MAG: hypothetical protein WAM69_01420 [Candidatus Sulfotelmatobacter sp.]